MDIESRKAAQKRYYDKTIGFHIKFRKDFDKEIVDWLNSQSNKCNYIRKLIKADIKQNKMN